MQYKLFVILFSIYKHQWHTQTHSGYINAVRRTRYRLNQLVTQCWR